MDKLVFETKPYNGGGNCCICGAEADKIHSCTTQFIVKLFCKNHSVSNINASYDKVEYDILFGDRNKKI